MFVVNLAFSDLCMMISQFPMFTVCTFSGGAWVFGPFLCELYAATGSVTGLCSICTMAVISLDRYNVIVRGMNGTPMTTGSILRSAVNRHVPIRYYNGLLCNSQNTIQ